MKDSHQFSVVITGEWPGSGQSTTASLLAKQLGFERIYAGFLFRKLAHIWDLEKNNYSFKDFENQVASDQLDIDSYKFTEKDFNEKTLHQWQHQLKKADTPELWDKLTDKQSLKALQKTGMVVEAKVGVLLDKTNLIKNFSPKHKIFKFLLTCPPEISAHRVIKRKILNGELPEIERDGDKYLELVRNTTTETIKRHLRDWERYEKIYGIYRSDIYKNDVIKVSTAEKTEKAVVDTLINTINQRLKNLNQRET